MSAENFKLSNRERKKRKEKNTEIQLYIAKQVIILKNKSMTQNYFI